LTVITNRYRDDYRIRASDPGDAPKLSALAIRSKAYWGYADEFMQQCRNELTWSADHISARQFDFQSCFSGEELVGFYALNYIDEQLAELEALFVEPVHIGSGIGRRMIEHAKIRATSKRVTKILIQGDPHAEEFYLATGAMRCGSRQSSSVPGRRLPLFSIRLDQPSPTAVENGNRK